MEIPARLGMRGSNAPPLEGTFPEVSDPSLSRETPLTQFCYFRQGLQPHYEVGIFLPLKWGRHMISTSEEISRLKEGSARKCLFAQRVETPPCHDHGPPHSPSILRTHPSLRQVSSKDDKRPMGETQRGKIHRRMLESGIPQ